MPYITRNNKGEIVELHNSPENGGGNWIEAQDPEVLDFIKRSEILHPCQRRNKYRIPNHESHPPTGHIIAL